MFLSEHYSATYLHKPIKINAPNIGSKENIYYLCHRFEIMVKTKANISTITGLTPTQERACNLLASGATVEAVAKEMHVTESTLLLWQKQTTFKCYFNQKRNSIKGSLTQGVYSLAQEAVNALRQSLNSDNEQVRLKAATYVVDKLQSIEVGQTDIVEAVRAEATYKSGIFDSVPTFHEGEFNSKLKELGITEQDYQSTL